LPLVHGSGSREYILGPCRGASDERFNTVVAEVVGGEVERVTEGTPVVVAEVVGGEVERVTEGTPVVVAEVVGGEVERGDGRRSSGRWRRAVRYSTLAGCAERNLLGHVIP
jgi:hypothetical protein